jgi:hypothetical protein
MRTGRVTTMTELRAPVSVSEGHADGLYAYTVIATGDSPTGWAVVRAYASGGHGCYHHYEPADARTGWKVADDLNESIGITHDRALRIIAASILPCSVWADEYHYTGDIR